jgi:hypothetical protein
MSGCEDAEVRDWNTPSAIVDRPGGVLVVGYLNVGEWREEGGLTDVS